MLTMTEKTTMCNTPTLSMIGTSALTGILARPEILQTVQKIRQAGKVRKKTDQMGGTYSRANLSVIQLVPHTTIRSNNSNNESRGGRRRDGMIDIKRSCQRYIM